MIRALLVAALALPAAANGDTVISPQDFDALSTGQTLYFGRNGEMYGIEQFHGNRTSTWQYGDGTCADGRWYPEGDAICFLYEGSSSPQCWTFTRRGGDYFARLRGRQAGDPDELKLIGKDTQPVPCPGPDLGV